MHAETVDQLLNFKGSQIIYRSTVDIVLNKYILTTDLASFCVNISFSGKHCAYEAQGYVQWKERYGAALADAVRGQESTEVRPWRSNRIAAGLSNSVLTFWGLARNINCRIEKLSTTVAPNVGLEPNNICKVKSIAGARSKYLKLIFSNVGCIFLIRHLVIEILDVSKSGQQFYTKAPEVINCSEIPSLSLAIASASLKVNAYNSIYSSWILVICRVKNLTLNY